MIYDYLLIQNNCYILIIPGFGIISHIVSTFSGKPIFGQDGPITAYLLGQFAQQTICRKFLNWKTFSQFNITKY